MENDKPLLYRLILPIAYLFVCTGAVGTYITAYFESQSAPALVREHPILAFFLLLFITQTVTIVDLLVRRKRIEVISAVYFGLMIGFLLSYLTLQAISPLLAGSRLKDPITLITSLAIPYICVSLLIQTRDDFRFVIPYVEFAREVKGGRAVVLDSSSLIDGRVADVVETAILDSDFIVPHFVLREVQEIADSNDKVRRTRGRRGLEILGKLQNNPKLDVQVVRGSSDSKGLTVDQRIIDMAKEHNARIMTNDFNLNKVAGVQGVDVINLNDVSNSLKPRFIPGERVEIKIMKEGESPGQGVGYLNDGTMVVCENASRKVGQDISVIVTSVLQSSAGRMIFGREVLRADSLHDDNEDESKE